MWNYQMVFKGWTQLGGHGHVRTQLSWTSAVEWSCKGWKEDGLGHEVSQTITAWLLKKNMLYIFKKVMHHWASNLWLNQSNPATTPSLRDFGHPWSIFWSSVRTCLCSYVILYDSHRWLWPSSEKPSSGITVGFAVTRRGFWWLMNYAIQ